MIFVSNLTTYNLSYEETISFLEKEPHLKSAIISNDPRFDEVGTKPIDCLIFNEKLMQKNYKEIVRSLMLLELDGQIIIDTKINYSPKLCSSLKEMGFNICLLNLRS